IAARAAFRLRGEPRFMQGAIKKIAGAVARKHAARAIAPMSGRRQSNDQQSSIRIAERWNGFAPVIPIEVCPAFRFSDAMSILHQARAEGARYDLVFQQSDLGHAADFHREPPKLSIMGIR